MAHLTIRRPNGARIPILMKDERLWGHAILHISILCAFSWFPSRQHLKNECASVWESRVERSGCSSLDCNGNLVYARHAMHTVDRVVIIITPPPTKHNTRSSQYPCTVQSCAMCNMPSNNIAQSRVRVPTTYIVQHWWYNECTSMLKWPKRNQIFTRFSQFMCSSLRNFVFDEAPTWAYFSVHRPHAWLIYYLLCYGSMLGNSFDTYTE